MSGSPQSETKACRGERRILAILFPVFFVVFGLLSVWLGQDANWDLCNYHYYNPYAFLHGRMGHDVNPAFMQTHFNPLLDIPFYLMARHLPPWVGGFLLGSIQGINAWLGVLIVFQMLPRVGWFPRAGLALFFAVAGSLAPANWLGIGRTFNDTYTTLFALIALHFLLRAILGLKQNPRALVWVALAGGVAGLGTGLKLTGAVYSAGLLAACWAVPAPWRRRAQFFLVHGAAGLAGLLCSSGFWFLRMWRMFKNPIFPAFNEFFESPYAPVFNFEDFRWFPRTVWQHLFYPFHFAGKTELVGELAYESYGLAVAYALGLAWIGVAVYRRIRRAPPVSQAWIAPGLVAPLLVFYVATYVAWQWQFSYYRYLAALEMLAPLVILVLAEGLLRRPRLAALLAITLVLGVARFNEYAQIGRQAWSNDWFNVVPPPLQDPDHTIVLMHDAKTPAAFVIPSFPPGVRFLRTQDNLLYYAHHRNFSLLQEQVREIIRTHEGPMYVLAKPGYGRLQTVHYYGLQIVPGSEQVLPNKMRNLLLWEARHARGAPEEAAK